MSAQSFDDLVQENLAVVFDDTAFDGLTRNARALSGLAFMAGASHQTPEPDELYALLALIRDEQERLLRCGVQKPSSGRVGGGKKAKLTTV